MIRFNLTTMILAAMGFAGFMVPVASADIYSWTDENGVRYFTNHKPPKHAELLIKSPEIPHDEEAHQQRLEEDRLAAARQELAEREAFLMQQQLETERRIAAANARADAALQEADQILRDAEAAAENVYYDRRGSYGYGYSYPYYRIGPRAPYSNYERYDLSLYRKQPYKYRRHHYKYGKYNYKYGKYNYRYGKHNYRYGKYNLHRRHHLKYKHYNKYRRHSIKYGHYNKHRSKGIYHNRHYRKHSGRSHHSLTRGRFTSHRSRGAAFRGRHGGRF